MKIQLEKMSNTRDLGGFPTANGIVKPHLLYRSGQLFFATEADLRKLSEEGITQIVDFRSEEERSEKPDPPVEGAK